MLMSLGFQTGMTRTKKCKGCGEQVKQNRIYIVPPGCVCWVSVEHNAWCGLPCFGAAAPGSAFKTENVHIRGKCPHCPTPTRQSRGPRSRVTSAVTASPILGMLTVNEVRVINYTITARLEAARHWVHAVIIGPDLKMPDATVRGTLKRLAARGIMRQDKASRAWTLNMPASVSHAELKPQ